MQRITPCLWFDSQAEEAARFYTSLFPNSKVGTIFCRGEANARVSGQPKDSVMTVAFTLDGQEFLGLNGGPMFQFSPAVSFTVTCDSAKRVDELWSALAEGGTALMPLDTYPWSERYGWLSDRFGVSWQLLLTDKSRGIAPTLMFVGDQLGKAEEGMNFYISQFPNSKLNHIARYEEGEVEGAQAGFIKHASFNLDGQEFALMDAPGPHPFSFEQSVSFIVNCKDQREVDRYWESLSRGGKPIVCGWLADRYGLPWQVVPTVLHELLKGDAAQFERVMTALLEMTKLDVGELERAAAAS